MCVTSGAAVPAEPVDQTELLVRAYSRIRCARCVRAGVIVRARDRLGKVVSELCLCAHMRAIWVSKVMLVMVMMLGVLSHCIGETSWSDDAGDFAQVIARHCATLRDVMRA
jgi:hypothetical protein